MRRVLLRAGDVVLREERWEERVEARFLVLRRVEAFVVVRLVVFLPDVRRFVTFFVVRARVVAREVLLLACLALFEVRRVVFPLVDPDVRFRAAVVLLPEAEARFLLDDLEAFFAVRRLVALRDVDFDGRFVARLCVGMEIRLLLLFLPRQRARGGENCLPTNGKRLVPNARNIG